MKEGIMEEYTDFEEMKKESDLLLSNFMFMILAFAFIGSSFLMQMLDISLKTSIIVIQYVIIVIPILIVMKLKRIDIKRAFRLNKISFMTVVKVVLITLACVPIAYFLNLLVNVILIKLDLFQVQTMDIGTGGFNFIVMFFLISITPGICEEIFFRGLMLSGYRNQTRVSTSIIVTGVLFGLFHFNIQNFMLPMFLGIILAMLVHITNSIYSSMIAHGLFNAIGLVIMYLPNIAGEQELTASETEASIELLEQSAPLLLGALFVISCICVFLLLLLINWLKSEHVKLGAGDTLYIKDRTFKVIGTSEESFVAEDDFKVVKTFSNKILAGMPYRLEKYLPVIEYEKISAWNIIFVGCVIILYVGLAIFSYI